MSPAFITLPAPAVYATNRAGCSSSATCATHSFAFSPTRRHALSFSSLSSSFASPSPLRPRAQPARPAQPQLHPQPPLPLSPLSPPPAPAAHPRTAAAGGRRRQGAGTGATRMSATEPPKKPTGKELAQLYGGSYLGTSVAMSLVSFGVLYALVYVGVDVRGLTNAFGDWLAATPLGRPAALDSVSDAAGAAAIAYVAHKVTSPLRFPLTIAATPFVASFFSNGARKSTDGGNDDSAPSGDDS